MNQEQSTIGYDQFWPNPLEERIRLFNGVSAENRALLIKAHIKRWLAANRPRLNYKQIAIVEEIIRSISPEWYKIERDFAKVEQAAEALRQKAEAVLEPEDMVQVFTNYAEYVPAIKGSRRVK